MKLSLLLGILIFPFLGFSQHDPAQVEAWVNEVYLDCPSYITTDAMLEYKSLANRYTYIFDANMSTESITGNLNQMIVKDKCNSGLRRDVESATAINPFKYFIDFYSKEKQIIKVGNTNH